MKHLTPRVFLAFAFIFAGPQGHAADPLLAPKQTPLELNEKKGPHGGQMVTEKGQDYEVKVDPQSGQMDVYSQSMATNVPPPDNMTVILYKNDRTGQTVRLRSVEPPRIGIVHYQGQVDTSETPYVAFGIQLDFPFKDKPAAKE